MSPDDWYREAERLYRRYQIEVVEACNLCPWAGRARRSGKTATRVVLEVGPNNDALLALIDELEADSRVEVAMLIFPRLGVGPRAFDSFVARLRDDDAARRPLGTIPFMLAAFHPEALADMKDAERLIPFLRRTPDPTIQLVRSSSLDAVRRGTPQGTQLVDVDMLERSLEPAALDLREHIARANLATVNGMGLDELTRTLDDICRDRENTYRASDDVDIGAVKATRP